MTNWRKRYDQAMELALKLDREGYHSAALSCSAAAGSIYLTRGGASADVAALERTVAEASAAFRTVAEASAAFLRCMMASDVQSDLPEIPLGAISHL